MSHPGRLFLAGGSTPAPDRLAVEAAGRLRVVDVKVGRVVVLLDVPITDRLSADDVLRRLLAEVVDAVVPVRRATSVERAETPAAAILEVVVRDAVASTVVSSFSLALFRSARVDVAVTRLLVMLLNGGRCIIAKIDPLGIVRPTQDEH
jgi:hypothetical protein